MTDPICRVDGCGRPVRSRGLCSPHYFRQRRHGDPLGGGAYRRPFVSGLTFWDRVIFTGFCWLWAGPQSRGYGLHYPKGSSTSVAAHRWAYRELVGPFPDELELDHLCLIPLCVNPDHLEPVTKLVNLQRAWRYRAEQQACRQGHEFTPENTYVDPQGTRSCRTCKRAAGRRRDRALRQDPEYRRADNEGRRERHRRAKEQP